MQEATDECTESGTANPCFSLSVKLINEKYFKYFWVLVTSSEYICFICLSLLKTALEIQGSWQSVERRKAVKKQSNIHFGGNPFYQSAHHFIRFKGILLEKRPNWYFSPFCNIAQIHTSFSQLQHVDSFVKVYVREESYFFLFPWTSYGMYTQNFLNWLVLKWKQKHNNKAEGIIYLSLICTCQKIKTVMNYTLLYKILLWDKIQIYSA